MRKLLVLTLTIILIPTLSSAQKWKRQRKEYSFGIGATNLLGDLGGRDQIGTDFIYDWEWAAIRYTIGIGYRYQLARDLYVKGNFYYTVVSGDDALTNEPARAQREFKIKSNIFELSGQLEYMLVKKKTGHLYRLRGVRGKSWFRFEIYALAGLGVIYYDPYGYRNGSWTRLAPLNTEGQGLPGGPRDYSQFSAVIPYGIGIRRELSGGARSRHFGSWSISLEITNRMTFTDYIDDVSSYYYSDGNKSPDAIRDAYGEDALYFHDPSGLYNNGGYASEQQRGDRTDDDAYFMGVLSVNYKPARRRRNLPKF